MEQRTIKEIQGRWLKAEEGPNGMRLYAWGWKEGGWVWIGDSLNGLIEEIHEIQAFINKNRNGH